MNVGKLILALGLLNDLGANRVFAASLSTQNSLAFENSASVDLVSSYIFRGVTLNKNEAIQPGVATSVEGVSFGLWGSLALDPEEDEGEQELDIYLSYDWGLSKDLSLSLGILEYVYPETDIENDREVSLGLSYAILGNPSIAANFGISGAIDKSNYYELSLGNEIFTYNNIVSSWGFVYGYIDPDVGSSGFTHLQTMLSMSYSIVTASIYYLFETDENVQSFEDQENLYASLGTSYTF